MKTTRNIDNKKQSPLLSEINAPIEISSVSPQTNREYADSIFRLLFKDKEKLTELYKSIKDDSETQKIKESDISLATLENALYKQFRDDLAFMVGNQFVVLVEHQGTNSQNLPLRMLLYVARIYEGIVKRDAVYRNSLVKIPFPEFYVMYNGKEDCAEEFTLKLSDAFTGNHLENHLDLTVTVLNINYEKHNKILKKSKTLEEYSFFINMVRAHRDDGYLRNDAIKMSILFCIDNGILEDFLKKHGSEVYNMLFGEWDEETARRIAVEEEVEKEIGKAVEKAVEKAVKEAVEKAVKESQEKSQAEIERLKIQLAQARQQGKE